MIEIFFALLYVGGLYFSSNGIVLGTYVLFALLGIHVVMIILASSAALATDVEVDKDAPDPNAKMNLLLQLFIVASAFHLYQIGYALFAGIVVASVTIAFITNTLSMFRAD